jgi:fructose-bisphosphate aldolase class I
MEETIKKLCRVGTGILAADESTGTIGKRFNSVGLENTHENRFNYRHMLFNAPNLENHISGVILYEETLFDKDDQGNRLVQPLIDKDIVLGIKTDLGLTNIPNARYTTADGEQMTKGVESLAERSHKYYEAGARFAKFRCVFKIDTENNYPSPLAIQTNSQTLAQYARISQQCGLVPIVEPEVLMDGPHTIGICERVTRDVLVEVYRQLHYHNVYLPYTILKPNMIRYGTEGPSVTDEEVAEKTVAALRDCVPSSVPMIAFLSGGMTEEEATRTLKLVVNVPEYRLNNVWRLTFSFGRALQQSALKSWAELVKADKLTKENLSVPQNRLLEKTESNGQATVVVWCDTC